MKQQVTKSPPVISSLQGFLSLLIGEKLLFHTLTFAILFSATVEHHELFTAALVYFFKRKTLAPSASRELASPLSTTVTEIPSN